MAAAKQNLRKIFSIFRAVIKSYNSIRCWCTSLATLRLMVRRRHPISLTDVSHPGYLAVADCIVEVEVELAIVVAVTVIVAAVGFAGPVALVGAAGENREFHIIFSLAKIMICINVNDYTC